MLAFAEELHGGEAGLRVLNLGGGDVDTSSPIRSMLFTIMAALGQMEHEIKRERVVHSITKRHRAITERRQKAPKVTDLLECDKQNCKGQLSSELSVPEASGMDT